MYINNVTTTLERLPRGKPPCCLTAMIAIDDAIFRHAVVVDTLRKA
jgi:hypothetical protein